MRILLRNMRKSPLLDALMPATRQRVLAATVLRPAKAWYLSELAGHLGVRPSTLQRELASLVRAGILRQTREGNRAYFQMDKDCPILPELGALVGKTIGLAPILKSALAPFRKNIVAAFIYGSVARAEEVSASDIDLMIVGRVTLSEISLPLRRLERQLGRPVNPTVYGPDEFAAKLAGGHHFLSTVIRQPRLFVIGDEHELEAVTKRRRRPASPNKPARNR